MKSAPVGSAGARSRLPDGSRESERADTTRGCRQPMGAVAASNNRPSQSETRHLSGRVVPVRLFGRASRHQARRLVVVRLRRLNISYRRIREVTEYSRCELRHRDMAPRRSKAPIQAPRRNRGRRVANKSQRLPSKGRSPAAVSNREASNREARVRARRRAVSHGRSDKTVPATSVHGACSVDCFIGRRSRPLY